MAKLLFLLISFLALFASPTRSQAEDFTKEFDSVYGHIIIRQVGTVVEMYATYKGWMARESGIDLADPSRIVVPYVKYLFAASAVSPSPRTALVIGMGGGGFNRLFNEVYPSAVLTSVEIDKKVVELAKEYMAFKETDKNLVAVRDGRSFVRRSKEKFDWIILDAFHGSVVPPHLKTRDFYREIAAHLTEGGICVANIHDDSELFYFDIATLHAAFSDVLMLKVPETGNVIVLAADWEPGTIEKKLASFDPSSIANPTWHREIPVGDFMRSVIRLDEKDLKRGRIMTDDFAPAEYYKIIPAAPSR